MTAVKKINLLDNQELENETLTKLLALVFSHTGITMNASKKALLQGRLRPRLRTLKLTSYAEYVDYLNKHAEEVQTFINLVTTNETSFFRTDRIWDYFNKKFLPQWHTAENKNPIKIWSAAASSGEEAHTIGICCENFKQQNQAFDYQITASDISSQVLDMASKGIYTGRSIENFRTKYSDLFKKYTSEHSDGVVITNDIRKKIQFRIHNLFDPFSQKEHFDIIFLRNVLIYFEAAEQIKVLNNIHQALKKNGILIIGESESLNRLKTDFIYIEPLIYKKSEHAI